MKKIITFFFLSFSLGYLANGSEIIDTTCHFSKLLPGTSDQIYSADLILLDSVEFSEQIDSLFIKMYSLNELTNQETLFLIRLGNTAWFSESNELDILLEKYTGLNSILNLFQRYYCKWIFCKFNCFWGKGGGTLIKELKINYTGDIFACSKLQINGLPTYTIR